MSSEFLADFYTSSVSVNQVKMESHTSFFDLGEDILYLIINQMHNEAPASLLQFANASKQCEKLAGPILYRSITLGDKGSKNEVSQKRKIFDRLLNKNDPIHDYVMELRIAEWCKELNHFRLDIPWQKAQANPARVNFLWNSSDKRNGESQLMGSLVLERVVQNLRVLKSFSWDAKSMIPERVISTLEKCHPNARLSVNNNRHLEKTAYSIMDSRLLSSPLLHFLNFSILHSTTSSGIVCSEFRQLKDILVQSPRLEVLSLAVHTNSGNDNHVSTAPLDCHPHSPIDSGYSLTKLHTLTIPQRFSFSGEAQTKIYSAILAQANAFTNLRRLDLTGLTGRHSFEPLKGRVPNVKNLEFLFKIERPDTRGLGHQLCRDATLIRDFLVSIDALETLQIISEEDNFDILWPGILKHRHSLQRFSIHTLLDRTYRREFPHVLSFEQIEQLQDSKISDLAFDVLIPDIAWVRSYHGIEQNINHLLRLKYSKLDHGLNNHDLDPSIALSLANLTRLSKIKIYIELPTSDSVFSKKYNYNSIRDGDPVPPLKQKPAEEVAVGLFEQIFVTDPKASLRELEVCFCRLDIRDRMDSSIVHNSVWIRKVQIDFINDLNAQGHEVEFQGGWACQD